MSEDKPDKAELLVAAQASLDKIVPKFCSGINIALLANRNIVLTLGYSEGAENAVIIERVVIDLEHAKNFISVLEKAIKSGESLNESNILG